jgi:hypothetical protein
MDCGAPDRVPSASFSRIQNSATKADQWRANKLGFSIGKLSGGSIHPTVPAPRPWRAGVNGTPSRSQTFLREHWTSPCTRSRPIATERTSAQSTRPGSAADINSAADLYAGIGALDFHKTGTERCTGIASCALCGRKPAKGCSVVQFQTVGRISQNG